MIGLFRVTLALPIVLLAAVSAAQGKVNLESNWRDREITIDGAMVDWQGVMTEIREGILVGVLNDEHFLYICVQSKDFGTSRRAMVTGLMLHLDPKGGKEIVIQYPIGIQAMSPLEPGGTPDREKLRRQIEEGLDELIILGGDSPRLAADSGLGIELRASGTNDEFVYELKIALWESEAHPYAVGAELGATVSLELEAIEPDREAMRARMGGGRGGGGMGGGGRGGQRPEMPEPLNVRAKVRLASAPVGPPEMDAPE